MSQPSVGYTVGFAAVVCVTCSLFVGGAAVALKDKQDVNKVLDRQKKVLSVAGLIEDGAKVDAAEVQRLFDENIRARPVDMAAGTYTDSVDAKSYDLAKAMKDPALSVPAPSNKAKVQSLAKVGLVYEVMADGQVDKVIVPIEGKGLWSTMYGYIALDSDGTTVEGITFYAHGETPGLGGEIDNARWKEGWKGRKLHDGSGKVALRVIKGAAGPAAEAPNAVDGLSGATLTCNGVTYALDFWFGKDAYGPFIDNLKAGKVNG